MERSTDLISIHKRGTSQCRPPVSITGSFRNRPISSMDKRPEWNRPRMARPLSAPRSNARYVDPPEVSDIFFRRERGLAALRVTRYRRSVSLAAYFGDALEITAFPKRVQGILRQAVGACPFADCRPNIGRKSLLEANFRVYQRTFRLARGQLLVIYNSGFRVQFLCGRHRLNHRLHLALQVVALVNHVGHIRSLARFPLKIKNLVEDPEYLIRVDGAEGQVVICIAAVVKMKPAKHVIAQKPSHDLLNILPLVMMTGIHQNPGLRPRLFREQQGHAPVGDIRVIKRRFKRFVFDEHSLMGSELLVKFRKALFEPFSALTNVCRSRVVGAVCKPQRNV